MPETDKGYYQKYTVIDNRTGEEVEGRTFTLNLDTDPHAAEALVCYAEAIENENPTLYRDLLDMLAVPV
jgi:hypothetical protein